jgi:hypothetical protein
VLRVYIERRQDHDELCQFLSVIS